MSILKIFGTSLLVIALTSMVVIFLNLIGVLTVKHPPSLWLVFGVCFFIGAGLLGVEYRKERPKEIPKEPRK